MAIIYLRFPVLLAVLWIAFETTTANIQFDRRTTGVGFSAYIKKEEGNQRDSWMSYSLNDIKTMIEVMSTKFSRIATFGVGAENVFYAPNKTYYEGFSQAYSAEAAALFNKERGNKSITILIGIWMADQSVQMDTEIQVAFESAKIANAIYDGTAEGIVFNHNEIGETDSRTQNALELMTRYKEQARNLGLKLGSRQPCHNIGKTSVTAEMQKKIVNISDFIICDIRPASEFLPSGPVTGFRTVKNDLTVFRKVLKDIHPNIEVMGQTGWPSKGDQANPWYNIDNLGKYWEIVDKWATAQNFTMWMFEAFDCPWKKWTPHEAHHGWWKLKKNADVGRIDGYAEKIFEPPEEEEVKQAAGSSSPWVYIGIALGVIVLLVFFGLVGMLFFRVNKLQASITNDDIREFMDGMSDEAAAAQGGQIESALKFPYDKSYEIPKEKLSIKRDALLGSGQFGCVYKALIDNEEKEKLEVALKMTKSDCPKTALKGILSEIKILTYLGKHPNIVSIYGAYTAELGKGLVYIATELCGLGSLENYLRNNQTSIDSDRYANAPSLAAEVQVEVSFQDMVRWSHEIACGMEYLGTKHVVHADLSTRNVLLANDRTAKITDFGLSRRLYDYTNYVKQQQEPLPWRWMAIESLKRLEFSSKSDVWSYGVTLWEIFAMGDLPYPGLSWNLDFVDSLVNGLRMKCPPHANQEVYKIMVDCWYTDPKDRPTFTDLKLSTAHILEFSTNKKPT